ncbi:MAG: cyclic pyranopterin monophosphate synthase MoaC [Betaproteobacteria bacterium]|nr:cyclic pyranopterin monophosphate synthase MoaC [Betaproteobacteria bacterium]
MARRRLTHFDSRGQARMVDVGGKAETRRVARAGGRIAMSSDTLEQIAAGTGSKGDVLGVARIAGIQAAKRTSELIPLCHPLALTRIDIDFVLDRPHTAVECIATAETTDRTGVEMEALTAVAAALLTVYDMCKAVDRGMRLERMQLLEKKGGKSGHWVAGKLRR